MINFDLSKVPDLERYLSLYYHKIIRIDLADDSYEIILMRDGERKPTTTNVREWMSDFVQDYVHPEDKDIFIDNTSRERFFKALEGEALDFTFHRRSGDQYFESQFIFIPDGHTDTTGYVFIKEIELVD